MRFFCGLKQATVPKIKGDIVSLSCEAGIMAGEKGAQSTAARIIECLCVNPGKSFIPVLTSSEDTQI